MMGNTMTSSFCRLELLQPSNRPIKIFKFSYKIRFYTRIYNALYWKVRFAGLFSVFANWVTIIKYKKFHVVTSTIPGTFSNPNLKHCSHLHIDIQSNDQSTSVYHNNSKLMTYHLHYIITWRSTQVKLLYIYWYCYEYEIASHDT